MLRALPKTMTTTTTTTLEDLIEDCYQEALRQGLPADQTWEATAQDVAWIEQKLGRKLTVWELTFALVSVGL